MTLHPGGGRLLRPVLVDLFGCEGGAAEGYSRAGFDVWSVDLDPARARHNRHTWFVGDWSEGLTRALDTGRVAVIHASPPCQAYSITKHTHDVQYPELLDPVREALAATGLPYVIENVVGAPMRDPLTLCGTEFGLSTMDLDGTTTLFLRRHRLFESNMLLWGNGGCRCAEMKRRGWKCGGVYGGGSSDRGYAENVRRGGYTPPKSVRSELLGGVPWMTLRGQAESLPPAFTQHLGEQLLALVPVAA